MVLSWQRGKFRIFSITKYVCWYGWIHDVECSFLKHNRLSKLLTHLPYSATYMRKWIGSALFQIIACRLFGAKPLYKLIILVIRPLGLTFSELLIEIQNFSFTKMHLKISSAKWRPFCPGEDELKCPDIQRPNLTVTVIADVQTLEGVLDIYLFKVL